MRYELRGRLEIESVAVDQCQAEVRAVIEAQGNVEGVEARITELQDQLSGVGDDRIPKSEILAEIKRLRRVEMPRAEAALEAARQALAGCRAARAEAPLVATS